MREREQIYTFHLCQDAGPGFGFGGERSKAKALT